MDGSTPLSYGSGFKLGSCFLLFEGTFTSVLKDKKSESIHKTVGEKKVFLTFLMMEGSGSVQKLRIRMLKDKKHADPMDPDPQHRYKAVFRIRIRIHRIHMFLGLPDSDPSIIMQK
jgi:hypothetical protein